MTGNVAYLKGYHESKNCTIRANGYTCLRDDYFTEFRRWFNIVYIRKWIDVYIKRMKNNKKLKSKK
jgi:hypothetical protein